MAEVTGLPQEGEKWVKDFDLHLARAQFSLHPDFPLDIDKNQGIYRLSFPLEFIQPTTFINLHQFRSYKVCITTL